MEIPEREDPDLRDRVETRLPTGEAGAQGFPQRSAGPAGRRGLWLAERQWRAGADADCRAAREKRSFLQPVPHDGAVLTHTRSNADRTKPSLGGYRCHSGDGDWLPGLLRDYSQGLCDVRRTA